MNVLVVFALSFFHQNTRRSLKVTTSASRTECSGLLKLKQEMLLDHYTIGAIWSRSSTVKVLTNTQILLPRSTQTF